jgi:hypothetical protein
MSTVELLKLKRHEILSIATRYGARNVRVFGSVVRGEDSPAGDIDFLVNMDDDRSLLDRVALLQDLGELLGRKVDVVSERALHWYVRDRVLAEAKPL